MVYRDIADQNQSTPFDFKYKVSLLDRFFSFLIDYLLFSPFVSFLLFLFFKETIRYWKMNPAAPEQTALTVLLGFSYVTLFSAFQAGFIYFWKATPGQYFLKIRLVFEHGEGLLFWRAFIRQFGFWLSIFFLGVPWIALLSHPQQKTFYDRIADCRVYSKKYTSEYFGFESEGRYWQSFGATLILFLSLIVAAAFVAQYHEVENRTQSFKQLEKKEQFCSEMKGIAQTSRLQLAIAMNLIGQLSDDCLDRESDFVLWKEKKDEMSLAYYAKSLTEEDHEGEKRYLKQACTQQHDSMGCRLSEAFSSQHFEKLYKYLKTQNSVLAKTLAYEFSLILNHPEDTSVELGELMQFSASSRLVKKYLLSEIVTRKTQTSRLPASLQDEEEQVELEEQALDLIKDL